MDYEKLDDILLNEEEFRVKVIDEGGEVVPELKEQIDILRVLYEEGSPSFGYNLTRAGMIYGLNRETLSRLVEAYSSIPKDMRY